MPYEYDRRSPRALIRLAMEHATPEALEKYLHEHPKADKSNHKVKTKGEEPKGEGKAEGKSEKPAANKVTPSSMVKSRNDMKKAHEKLGDAYDKIHGMIEGFKWKEIETPESQQKLKDACKEMAEQANTQISEAKKAKKKFLAIAEQETRQGADWWKEQGAKMDRYVKIFEQDQETLKDFKHWGSSRAPSATKNLVHNSNLLWGLIADLRGSLAAPLR